MEKKTIHMPEAIVFGWKTMKENIGFFIGFLIVVIITYAVPGSIQSALTDRLPFLAVLVALVAWVIQRMIDLGIIRASLAFCDNRKGRFADLLSTAPVLIKYIAGTILYLLIVSVGFILLIVPGVIFGLKYQFFAYFILEKGAGPIEAIRKSSQITKGALLELLIFGILTSLINLIGLMCCFVGIFATIPTTMVAYARVYRDLLKQTEQAGTAPTTAAQ